MSGVFLPVLPTTKKVEGKRKGGQEKEKEKGKRRVMRIGGGRKRITLHG